MANRFRTNQTPTNHSYSMWQTVMTLMDAGWSCLAWSDGSTANLTGTVPGPYAVGPSDADPVFPASGTFMASGSASANGFGNSRAWVLLRQPKGTGSLGVYAGTRMFVFQRGSTDLLWKIKYSKDGVWAKNGTSGHSGPVGLATSQNAPSPEPSFTYNDEVSVFGAGTDASPSFNTLFNTTNAPNGTSRHNVMANDGLSAESAPFSFYSVSWAAGGGVFAGHALLFDACLNGTTPALDADPYVIYADGGTTIFRANSSGSFNCYDQSGISTWWRYGLSSPAGSFASVAGLSYAARDNGGSTYRQVVPGDNSTAPLGTNSINNFDDFFPVAYGRPGSQGGNTGYKGVSSTVRWLSTSHAIGDTFALLTTRDRLSLVAVTLPWDGSVPSI